MKYREMAVAGNSFCTRIVLLFVVQFPFHMSGKSVTVNAIALSAEEILCPNMTEWRSSFSEDPLPPRRFRLVLSPRLSYAEAKESCEQCECGGLAAFREGILNTDSEQSVKLQAEFLSRMLSSQELAAAERTAWLGHKNMDGVWLYSNGEQTEPPEHTAPITAAFGEQLEAVCVYKKDRGTLEERSKACSDFHSRNIYITHVLSEEFRIFDLMGTKDQQETKAFICQRLSVEDDCLRVHGRLTTAASGNNIGPENFDLSAAFQQRSEMLAAARQQQNVFYPNHSLLHSGPSADPPLGRDRHRFLNITLPWMGGILAAMLLLLWLTDVKQKQDRIDARIASKYPATSARLSDTRFNY